jgi:hypothetical protein
MFGKKKCVHKWKILSDHVFESEAERAQRLNFTFPSEIPMTMFQKVHEVIITCTECGEIKHLKDFV